MDWPTLLELNQFSRLVKSDEANIFVSHIRFNKEPVNSVFPEPEANPVSQFKSAWVYYSISRLTDIPDNTMNTFLKSSDALQEIKKKKLDKTKFPERFFHFSDSNLCGMGLEQENIQNMKLVES